MRPALLFCLPFVFHCSMNTDINQTFFLKQDPHLRIGRARKIADVDFNNLSYYTAPAFDALYRVSNGSYRLRQLDAAGLPSAYHSIKIMGAPHYLVGEDEYVLLHIYNEFSGGSSWRDSQLHLYGVRDNSLYLFSTLFYDGSEIKVDGMEDGTINVRWQPYLDGDLSCCATGIEFDEFTVENDSFVLKSFRTVKRKE